MLEDFPALQHDGFDLISAETIDYNCVAWAADDNKRWWEPDFLGLEFWPPNVPRDYRMESYVAVFATIGYVICNSGDIENGQEKIAIYENSLGEFTHVAWQMADGRWSSKLGEGHDIIHNTVNGLYSEKYGAAKVYMKRNRRKRISV